MLKPIAKLLIATLLTILLITSNTLAFHKDGKSNSKKTDWTGDPKEKDKYQKKFKKNYCAYKTKTRTIEGKEKFNKDTGEPILDNNEKPTFEVSTYKVEIEGYHSTVAINIGGKTLFPFNVNTNFDENQFSLRISENSTLKDVLDYFCVQNISENRPESFKGSYLEDFYTEIAKDNGLIKLDGSGNFKQKIGSGDIYDKITREGLLIKNKNAVYYLPDNYLEEFDRHVTEKTNAKKEAEEKAAIVQGNNSWISENKQNYIDEFKEKLNEYEKVITYLDTKRNRLVDRLAVYEKQIKEAKKKIKTTFVEVNIASDEIKVSKLSILAAEETFLSGIEFKEYDKRLGKIKDIKFEKYRKYKKLLEIIKKAEKSKQTSDFVGKTGFEFPLPESLGGNWKIFSDKNGFIKDFNNLGELTSESRITYDDMNALDKDIEYQISQLEMQIFTPLEELMVEYKKLQKDKSWITYAIYFIIFLVVVGFIIYHFYSRKKLRDAERKAEERIGNLKEDFYGKLRNTSDEIKSVSRAARSQQSTQSSVQETVQETPKTPEEIIASKYDALVTDYNEALEDFTKVAAFKQKWHGLALSRKERQDGTKTILISSSSAFEKSGIWCVTFDDNYFAFPGSTVKSNMATYMNMDFMKANMNFKGIFTISTGSSYSTEPAVIRKGGAGFVVERIGKITFPN